MWDGGLPFRGLGFGFKGDLCGLRLKAVGCAGASSDQGELL